MKTPLSTYNRVKGHFYYVISQDESKVNDVIDILTDKNKLLSLEQKTTNGEEIKSSDSETVTFDKFVKDARTTRNGIILGSGTRENMSGTSANHQQFGHG